MVVWVRFISSVEASVRGAKMATVPVGRLRRCVWTGSVASVVMAVMVRLIASSFSRCVLALPCLLRRRLFRVRLYHMLCPGFAFRAFLASAAHLSCGMIGGRQEKTDTKR